MFSPLSRPNRDMTALNVSANDSITRPLKTAIVGGLQAINVLLPAFESVPDFQITALGARHPESLHSVAARLGLKKIYGGWEPLVNDVEIDVVALALPAAVQAPAARRLAEAGKHLFCEKPLATTYADAERIVSAVATAERKAIVHFGFRFVDAFGAFAEIVRSGELGRPQLVNVEWLLSTRSDPTFSWNWKSDAAQGGGSFFLMASHVLDYLVWWFGDIRDLELLPSTVVRARPDAVTKQPRPVLADDTCNMLMTLNNDVPANVSISTALSVGGNHRIRAWFEQGLLEISNGASDDYYDGFKLTFQRGRFSTATPALTAARVADTQTSRAPITRVEIARRTVEALGVAIRTGRPAEPSLDAGLKVQHWLEAGRRASSRWQSNQ